VFFIKQMKRIPAKVGQIRVLSRHIMGWQRFYTLIEKRENGECVIECSGSSNEYVPNGPVKIRGIQVGNRVFLSEYQDHVPVAYKNRTVIKRIEEFESLFLLKN
jgi:hypothetical protein